MKGLKCKHELHVRTSHMLPFGLDIKELKRMQFFAWPRQCVCEYFEACENIIGEITNRVTLHYETPEGFV